MVLDKYESFVSGILDGVRSLGVDVSDLEMDHIAYQAESDDDYDSLKPEFARLGQLVSEELVNGRRVGIYELGSPLHFQQYINTAIELIAPKTGQNCPSALEHVEFVIKESFVSFMRRYQDIPWDTAAINQPRFPMIRLKLGDHIQVKFHLSPVLEIIRSKGH